jgi:hypothetical protein
MEMKNLSLMSTYAELSLDGLYRWMLGRVVEQPGSKALWIGVNPSTADAEQDDQSIRKLYGFGEKLGIQEWMVGNLFAYRSTDVKELANVTDPVGDLCDHYLRFMIDKADHIIGGWGRIDKVPPALAHRVEKVVAMVKEQNKKIWCWGTCQDGSPRHPLMVPYSTRLVVWA